MSKSSLQSLYAAFAGLLLSAMSSPAMNVKLTPSLPSPSPVGTMITWTASVPDESGPMIWYRFRVRELGGSYKIVRDYGPLTSLDWTAADHEGLYEMELSVRNLDTGESNVTSAVYEMLSQLSVRNPVVNPTSHPLVFLYSALCPGGARMKVQFRPVFGGLVQETPYKACQDGRSANFYLAGLQPYTEYIASHVIDTGAALIAGPNVVFEPGQVPSGLFTEAVVQAPAANLSDPILLGSSLNGAVATDLAGNPLWYTNNGIYVVTRPEDGGYFWGYIENFTTDIAHQVIRKFDLVGMTVLETNAARVNEQLAAMGRRQINSFHHEARTLPDGKIVALADVEQILTDVQGPGPVDVIGDMIVVFDSDLNVIWAWDAFDNLDVKRAAVLGEKCLGPGGCSPYYLAKIANDWTHGNAVHQTPDGQLLFSSRHQDWLIKISYDQGHGDGHVIWRLGKDGDFQVDSADPYPWFSHQHDANFDSSDPTALLVFDNGNTRQVKQGGNSRGQVLRLDEQNRKASFILNADLGVRSFALGSAQKLPDQNYHFDAGFVTVPGGSFAYSIEVDGTGNIVYETKASTILYRTFRMTSMYTPN